MKKRILILSALLTFSIVGCNTSKETAVPVENSVAESMPVETATPEPTAEPTPIPEPTATPIPTVAPTSAPSTEAPIVTETPAAGEVVGEDPLANFSDEDIQSIFDQVAGTGNSNDALFTEDGRPISQNNPDWVGGKAPDGSQTEWSN